MKLSFGCNLLLLLTTHTTHSLALHAHHKRMEDVTGVKEIEAAGISTQPIPQEHTPMVTIPPHDPSSSIEHIIPPLPSSSQESHTHSAPPIDLPIDSDSVTPFHHFLATSSSKSLTPFYSHAQQLQEDFGCLLAGNFDGLVISAIRYMPLGGFLHRPAGELRIMEEEETMTRLNAIREFLRDELPQAQQNFECRSQEIKSRLHTIINPNISQSHTSQILNLIGMLASAHRSRLPLDTSDPTLLRIHKLVGILGPGNLFAREIKVLLANHAGTWNLPSELDTAGFVEDLEKLSKHISLPLNYSERNDIVKESPHHVHAALGAFHLKYVSKFRSRDTFAKLIDDILKSDVHKSLELESLYPTDLVGYQLGLIEAFGNARHGDEMLRNSILDLLGVSNHDETTKDLEKLAFKAQENMQQYTDFASHALRLKEDLDRYFTPSGYVILVMFMDGKFESSGLRDAAEEINKIEIKIKKSKGNKRTGKKNQKKRQDKGN